jgi:hypothetical protein
VPGRIVGIQDHRTTRLHQVHEEELSRAVLLERAVVVEMVATEIGEQSGIESGRGHTSLVQRVRRHLHRDRAGATGVELTKPVCKSDGARGGEALRSRDHLAIRTERAQRSDGAGRHLSRKQVPQNGRAGGLPVGPGDSHEREVAPGIGIKGSGGKGCGEPATRHGDLQKAQVGGGFLDEGGQRTRGVGFPKKAVPIAVVPADRTENRAGSDGPGIGRDVQNLSVHRVGVRPGAGQQQTLALQSIDQLSEGDAHGNAPFRTSVSPLNISLPASGVVRLTGPLPFTRTFSPRACDRRAASRMARPSS